MSKALSSTVSAPSGLFGVFTNRRISTKIRIGFALHSGTAALISAMSYVGFGKIDRDVSGPSHPQGDQWRCHRRHRYGFLAMRRYVAKSRTVWRREFRRRRKTRRMCSRRAPQPGAERSRIPSVATGEVRITDQFDVYCQEFRQGRALKRNRKADQGSARSRRPDAAPDLEDCRRTWQCRPETAIP